ncbi:MAG: hypothetical protein K0R71_1900 [Bacillales bacterium]|jgi:hypothetical protein|nr:hypothetical protein [Bacillales bacterium]
MLFVCIILFLSFLYYFHNPFFIIFSPIFLFIGWKLPYLFLLKQKNYDDILKNYLFPNFLKLFISLFTVKETVLKTLQATTVFLENGSFKKELENLIVEIEERNIDSSTPYIKFANYIGTSEAHLVMSFLFEFDHEGIKKQELQMLASIVQDMHENMVNEICVIKENSMMKYANIPIFIALIFIFLFVASIFYYYLANHMPSI